MKNNQTAHQQLLLSTVAFGIAFAVWGSIGGAAPLIKKTMGLTPFKTAILVSIPIILGSLGRIPIGLFTDRWGTRLLMTIILTFSGICALAIAFLNPNYSALLFLASLLGISGTAFVVGIAHISEWFPKERQGSVLGLFGMGNIGQSIAVFGIPYLAFLSSWRVGFIFLGALSLIGAAVYWTKAKEFSEVADPSKSLRKIFQVFSDSPMAWILSVYYSLTFGGFVAMAVYLPTLFRAQFLITPQEGGIRTAIFVILATLMRPLGGFLSDQWNAARILFFVFCSMAVSSIFLMSSRLEIFSLGLIAFAIAAGLGNGIVFKLVPYYFPKNSGAVTGLVGAAGGMGGFFPPLVMGASLQYFGNYALGWMGLLIFCGICLIILWNTATSRQKEPARLLVKEGVAG